MKVTLEFNLPEDKEQYDLANQAQNIYSVLWEFDQYLRNALKHGHVDFKATETKTIAKIRQELHNFMEAGNVKFE